MEKNYVYKVCSNGYITGNLQTAIQVCMDEMGICDKISQPIVSKIRGGYQVTAVKFDGSVLKRKIDVFTPDNELPQKKYKIDRTFHTFSIDW